MDRVSSEDLTGTTNVPFKDGMDQWINGSMETKQRKREFSSHVSVDSNYGVLCGNLRGEVLVENCHVRLRIGTTRGQEGTTYLIPCASADPFSGEHARRRGREKHKKKKKN